MAINPLAGRKIKYGGLTMFKLLRLLQKLAKNNEILSGQSPAARLSEEQMQEFPNGGWCGGDPRIDPVTGKEPKTDDKGR